MGSKKDLTCNIGVTGTIALGNTRGIGLKQSNSVKMQTQGTQDNRYQNKAALQSGFGRRMNSASKA